MSQRQIDSSFWISAFAALVFAAAAALDADGQALAFAAVFGACALCIASLEE